MENIQIGDYIKLKGQHTVHQVLSVKGNDLEVTMGPMKMMVKRSKVELAEAPESTREDREYSDAPFESGIDVKSKLMNFKFELDVKGKMKDEVMVELSTWVDDAILLGIQEAKVLHGRGSGVIRDTVRSFLKKYPEVESLRDGDQHQGGEYVTVVKFKQ